jgi:S-adenosylmethionine-diacylgycerolhomoserine-N-methlytransferase
MMLGAELRTLRQLLRGMAHDLPLAERLQCFYGPQAAHYDRFRERLLHGRAEMIHLLDPEPGQHVVELGAGTARAALYLHERLAQLGSLTLVDLCPALLAQARTRTRPWPRTRVIESDCADWRPPHAVERVYLSYALSMMPRWTRVLDGVAAMLCPGGRIGVVDFHVSAAEPARDRVRHCALARHWWPWWFAHDGVDVGPQRLAALEERFKPLVLREARGSVPYLPGLRVPYFIFIGTPR